MTIDFEKLAVSGVQQLSPYQPGKPIDELAREFDLNPDDIVKLASNENPLGPSAKAVSAIQKECTELTRYPDGNGFELKTVLSSKLGVSYRHMLMLLFLSMPLLFMAWLQKWWAAILFRCQLKTGVMI